MTHLEYKNLYELLSGILAEAGVPPVVIGGFAVNFHRVSRQTLDIDLLMTGEDFVKCSPLFEESGCELLVRGDLFARFRNKKLSLMEIDFVFVDRETFERVLREGKKTKIRGIEFHVPSLNHLLAMKLHAMKNSPGRREFRDLSDVLDLIKVNKVDVRSTSFKALCNQFGTPEIYQQVLSMRNK